MANDTQSSAPLTVFTDDVEHIVKTSDTEDEVTTRVAARLKRFLADGHVLPPEVCVPREDRYVMYPLHVAQDGSFSIAAAVWNVNQGTPVHGHETWGVVGIYSGVEREKQFEKPTVPDVPLKYLGTSDWHPGEVTVCCTTDDDIHQVNCEGDVPVVGIHVYGADIGALKRRTYDPATGEVSWFVSHWPSAPGSEAGSDAQQ